MTSGHRDTIGCFMALTTPPRPRHSGLEQRGDLVCRYKLATLCLGQPFFDRSQFVVVGVIKLTLLRLQREQQLRGIFLALGRPGQNAVENLFYLLFGHGRAYAKGPVSYRRLPDCPAWPYAAAAIPGVMKSQENSALRTVLVHCTQVCRCRACALPARVPIERFWTACSPCLAGTSGRSAAAGVAGAGSLSGPFALALPGAVPPAADEKGLGIVTTASSADHPTRRDFLFVATGAAAAVGGAAAIWPLVAQMNPDASTIAAGAPIEVDLTPIAEGQDIKVFWRGKPIYIMNRTKKQIEEARSVNVASLPDPQPDSARVKEGHDQWLVVIGICTHLGCIPIAHDGNYDGFFCPCHGSQYDSSGRIRQGPAPANLAVPPYAFLTDSKIKIG